MSNCDKFIQAKAEDIVEKCVAIRFKSEFYIAAKPNIFEET